jgi:HlyD family secretion protein
MKKILFAIGISAFVLITGCNSNGKHFDASGTFEADETIVSSELSGKILSLSIEEGSAVSKDSVVGMVDAVNVSLQKEQVEASIQSLNDKTVNAGPQIQLLQNQIVVQESQMNNLQHEKQRIENLIKADAATGKQLDDINAQIDVLRKQIGVTKQQINVQQNNVATQNRSILSESKPLSIRAAQLNDQLKRAEIINPVGGTVITKYAQPGEITSAGKALYKVADLSTLTLRAYITGTQLSQIKLGQSIKVLVDDGKDKYKELPGTVTWISDKAEFTPKTIQTKEERVNLVYAMKVKVKNDGYLKIGMYGEVKFQ